MQRAATNRWSGIGELSGPGRRAIATLLALALLVSGSGPVFAQTGPAGDCTHFEDTGYSVCGAFAGFWTSNDGGDLLGAPLTDAYVEISADKLDELEIQYFERGRLERHAENAGTAYEILPGRVGAEVLEYVKDTDWHTFPEGDSQANHYFAETGHAVDAEFWDFFRGHGLDLGDEGVSLREALGLFGYPISEATVESNFGGGEVLTQWFERARLEVDQSGQVVMANLGIEMTSTLNGFSPRIQRELDANVVYWAGEFNDTGLMAGLWVPGVGEWSNITGAANRETGEPMRFDRHVRIGSISKEFTATLILQLADQGLLSIDDTIDNWVDGIPNGDRITLRHLASMTSGLASFTFDPEFQDVLFNEQTYEWTPDEIVAIGVENTLAGCPYVPTSCFEPGEGWMYSNTNTVLLGMVVEAVSGKTYADLLQEMIFDPLGMDDTYHPTTSDMPEPYAHGYTTQGLPDDATGIQDATNWNPSWAWAVGSLISTFDDLAIWARAVGSGELLSEEMQAERLIKETHPPNTPNHAYAFGIGYINGWWGHGGSIPGYNTTAYYRPDIDAVMVVVANSDQARYQDGFIDPAHTFADILIEIAEREAPLGDFADDAPWGDLVEPE